MNRIKKYYWQEIFKSIQDEQGIVNYVQLSEILDKNAGTLHNSLNKHKDIGIAKFLDFVSKMDKGAQITISSGGKDYRLKV